MTKYYHYLTLYIYIYIYIVLNGRPSPSNKYQNTTAPLENEARTIVMQKNLSVNSKLVSDNKKDILLYIYMYVLF